MNFHSNEQMWQCYSCAHEEVDKEKSGGGQKSESVEPSAPQEQDTELQKKCPMCGGRMDFLSNEQMWQCYSCGHEESTKDEVQGNPAPASKRGFDPFPNIATPLADLSFNEKKEPKKAAPPPVKKKTCPACHKKMHWYPDENAWRCPHCEYERRI
jgi:ribosomal protein L37AE/L43A